MLAALSSLHLLGLAVVMSAVFGSSLRSLNVLFVTAPLSQVYHSANRLLGAGLAVSAVSGFLMFMPRAAAAMANPTFRAKLALIGAGIVVYGFAFMSARSDRSAGMARRMLAASPLMLWLGVVLAGCAFILLE